MDNEYSPLNVIETAAASRDAERVDLLATGATFRLERIVSLGQTTPSGEWYDQERAEWVMLASGRARLAFEGMERELALSPGDSLLIEAHRRHRVTWTDPSVPTVWIALHFDPA